MPSHCLQAMWPLIGTCSAFLHLCSNALVTLSKNHVILLSVYLLIPPYIFQKPGTLYLIPPSLPVEFHLTSPQLKILPLQCFLVPGTIYVPSISDGVLLASKSVGDTPAKSALSVCFFIPLQDELGPGLGRGRSWTQSHPKPMLTPQGALKLRNPFRMAPFPVRRLVFIFPHQTVSTCGLSRKKK